MKKVKNIFENEKPAFVIVYQCLNCDYSFAHLYDYGADIWQASDLTVEITPAHGGALSSAGYDNLKCNKCGHGRIEIIKRSMIEY